MERAMKTPLILAAGLAAGLALAAAVPSSTVRAQSFDPRDRETVRPAGLPEVETDGWTLKRREEWLDDRINKAHDEHALDGHEADRAHHALDELRDDEHRMRDHHDGQLTDNETINLEARLDDLADEIVRSHNESWRRPW
jgi:hypothetical protein